MGSLVLQVAIAMLAILPRGHSARQISTQVRTEHGFINGTLEKSQHSLKFLAFKGIPYAKPPINNLRFRPPQEPDAWTGVRNAHQYSDSCIQLDVLTERNPKPIGSEDCLYLNVYTPVQRKSLLPVIVFIHYGAFITGNGNERLGPELLMDKRVVLVTFNYRLGLLGFFSTGDDASPGNYALKDQNFVLRWVKRNIEHFGGDPKNVVLGGQSAGAGSTHLHMLSPLSQGLFHKAITQSGTALALWASPLTDLQVYIGQQFAKIVQCDTNTNGSTSKVVECLRGIDAETIVNKAELLKTFFMEPINLYTPVIEKQTKSNPEPFLTKTPLEYINEGRFQKVPWIVGAVRDEGILRVSPFLRNEDIKTALLGDFDKLAAGLLGISLSVKPEMVDDTWRNVSDQFFGDRSSSFLKESKSIQQLIDLYSDRAFVYNTYQSVLLHASKGHERIFFYSFEYRGKMSYGDAFALTKNDINFDWGVCHCDDLLYLFKSSLFSNELQGSDALMSKIMVQMWTDFAKTGNPTLSKQPWRPVKNLKNFSTFKDEDISFLNISGPYEGSSPILMKMDQGFYKERMVYWQGLPLVENAANVV